MKAQFTSTIYIRDEVFCTVKRIKRTTKIQRNLNLFQRNECSRCIFIWRRIIKIRYFQVPRLALTKNVVILLFKSGRVDQFSVG
jgi:hypothetical protein